MPVFCLGFLIRRSISSFWILSFERRSLLLSTSFSVLHCLYFKLIKLNEINEINKDKNEILHFI